ncbi:hypothetical protein WJX82_004690 [Trebouxia sp. C0006]
MHVVEVGRQTSDELSVTGNSQLCLDEAESECLLTGSSARGAIAELCTGQSEVSISGDHQIPLEAWYQQPKQECLRLVLLGVPLSAQAILSFSSTLVSMAFIGHLGKHELSAAVLGTSLFNVTGLSILIGLCSAMETLCGQSFGAKNYSNLGIILQRALLVTAAACVLVVSFWTQMTKLLVFLGQDEVISQLAARYIQMLIPALAFSGVTECLKRYLMTQRIINPSTIIAAITTVLSIPYNLVTVTWLGLGLDGAALAVNVAQFTTMMGLLVYIGWREKQLKGTDKQTWHGWDLQCLRGWWPYVKIAVPSLAMICVEWWCFEAIILLAGRLPHPEVAIDTVGICVNIATTTFMFPFGLAGAASVRVSNELGAGRPAAARLAAQSAAVLALTLMAGCAVLLASLHRVLPLIITSDPAVVEGTQRVVPIVAYMLIGDGVNAVLAGVVRGCGQQAKGAAVNVVTYWCLGLPLSVFLAFPVHYGVPGLWAGLACTTTLQASVMSILVHRFDFAQEAKRAAATAYNDLSAKSTAHTEASLQLAAIPQPVTAGIAV